ncbi:MAG: Holliday junction resolvase RuvX [Acidobacteriales bacterium]|nr:Holliday junction resolvase RuvX [Terriglobales bacterium]
MALDLGSKRIGAAVTDGLGVTVQGLPTIERRGRTQDLRRIMFYLKKNSVREIVVGHPLHMSGDAGTKAKKAEEFATLLREKSGLPVHLHDERLTSWEAEQILERAGKTAAEKKMKVDEVAAVLILESFLASRK